jgi:endonuclease-3
MTIKERYDGVLTYFSKNQPMAETELHYRDGYELMVAVILSAQCTDKRVNSITPGFFSAFPDAASLSRAVPEDVFPLIQSCSYPNNKAKHLVGMARSLIQDFQGEIPKEVDQLMRIPGVGRKTANVIASVLYHQPAMAVDTHVFRVAARIGLTRNARNPFQAEKQLVQYIPEQQIPLAHHWLILHGRYVCLARKPRCHECGLQNWCSFYSKNVVHNDNSM